MTTNQNRGDAVKRYDMKERVRGMESWYELERDPDGDYVSFEDYSALQLRVTSLEGVVRDALKTAEFERHAPRPWHEKARSILPPSGPQEA